MRSTLLAVLAAATLCACGSEPAYPYFPFPDTATDGSEDTADTDDDAADTDDDAADTEHDADAADTDTDTPPDADRDTDVEPDAPLSDCESVGATCVDSDACPDGTFRVRSSCEPTGGICCATGRDPSCDDGSPLVCAAEQPSCDEGSIAAIIDGCWSCVNPTTCLEWGVPGCTTDADCEAGEECDVCATSSCPACDDCVAACVPMSYTCDRLPGFDPYLGCTFWAADLPVFNDPLGGGPETPFGIVVTNPGPDATTVSVEVFAEAEETPEPIDDVVIRAGGSVVIELPQLDVSGTRVDARAFRVTSNRRVSVQQFSPINEEDPASGDASLLFDQISLGTSYFVATTKAGVTIPIPPESAQRSWFVVVATRAGQTTVNVTPSARVQDGDEITDWGAGEERSFVLDQGDVLSVAFVSPPLTPNNPTGSWITSSAPVVVFSGHEQATVGKDGINDACCADHIQEQLPPVASWGTSFVAVHSPPRGTEPDHWIVVASEDGTTFASSPAVSALESSLDAGEWVAFDTTADFTLNASAPVLVARALVGNEADGVSRPIGDPSLTIIRPTNTFGRRRSAWVPPFADEAWLVITASEDADVALDDTPLGEPTLTIGPWQVWRLDVASGLRRIEGDGPLDAALVLYDEDGSYELPTASW